MAKKSKKTETVAQQMTIAINSITESLSSVVADAGDNQKILDRIVKLAATAEKISKSAKTIDEREAKKAEREEAKAKKKAAKVEKLKAAMEKIQTQLEELE